MASSLTNVPFPTMDALQAVHGKLLRDGGVENGRREASTATTEPVRANRPTPKVEKPLDLTPWPSRRRSDYVTALLLVNSFIGLLMMYGHQQPLILYFGAAAILSWTLGLTWIVWVVMDRY